MRYGGLNNDDFHTMQRTTDGGFILTGWSNSNADGNKSQEIIGIALEALDDFWTVKSGFYGE